eukprot:2661712-Rhodomonas_salina.1
MLQDLQLFVQRAYLQNLQCFKTCNTSSISNVQQQQPSTFQRFIDFERETAATFYFLLRQFQTCNSSNLLLSNALSISNVQQQQPSTFQRFVNKPSLGCCFGGEWGFG